MANCSSSKIVSILLVLLSVLVCVHEADAAEGQPTKHFEGIGGAGFVAGSSAWRSDPVGQATLTLGIRSYDIVAIYVQGRLGYGQTDDREVMSLVAGASIWARLGKFRPYARLGIVHQHEETISAIHADPGGAALGIGDGIRHRGGGEAGLGLDFPLATMPGGQVVVSGEVLSSYFPDPRGPQLYVMGGLGIGGRVSLF